MSFLQKLESKYCVVSGAQEIARKKFWVAPLTGPNYFFLKSN